MAVGTRTLASVTTDDSPTNAVASLTRLLQPLTQLEDAFNTLWGRGVLPGGGSVTNTAGFTVRVPSGTRFFQDGYVYTLAANQDYTAASASATVYLWGRITVTRADPFGVVTLQDTYTLTLTHNTTGVNPDATNLTYFLIASWSTDGSGVTGSIIQNPNGKFVHPAPQRGYRQVSIAGTGTYTLSATEARDGVLEFTGILTGNRSVVVPTEAGIVLAVVNNATGAFTVTVKTSAGTGIVVAPGKTTWLAVDRANVIVLGTDLTAAGAAPLGAQFVTLATDPTLTAERVLVAGAALALTDGGAGGNATLDVNVDNATLEVNADALRVKASGIQDSHLATPYIKADGTRAFTGDQSLGSHKLTNVTDPSAAQDAATKAYVDAVASGLDVKASCRAASTGNLTLSGTQTIDGVACIAGDRVLVKDQSTGSQNGLYVAASGAWSRAADADTNAEVTSGLFTFVEEGTVNAGTGWVLTTANPLTVGSTGLSFTQFSGAGEITAGTGLTKSGNTLNAGANADGSILVNADDIQVGVLATDGQHGNRGGGSLHAGAVAAGAAGFLSGSDKSKLDGVAAGAPALGLIVFGAQGALPSALTRYLAPGSGSVSINEIKVRLLVACTAQLLAVRTSAAPGTGVSDVLTVRKNGSDTALTATLADTNTEAEDTGHTVAFASGDDLSVKLVSGTLTASQDMMVSLVLK